MAQLRPRLKNSPEAIRQAVSRFEAGEKAIDLAKEYKVSRPSFYSWIKKYRALEGDKLSLAGSPKPASCRGSAPGGRATQPETVVELKAEVLRLKRMLFDLMIETGRL